MFEVFKGISSQIVKEIFQFRDAMPYQLRERTSFQIPSINSVLSGTESILHKYQATDTFDRLE